MATISSFDFEKPIADLEQEIKELEEGEGATSDQSARLAELRQRLAQTQEEVYSHLTPWQRVQMSRHIARPHALDYIKGLFTDWTELHGDRGYADDHACVAGLAAFEGRPVAVIGQQKGADLRENTFRNYGMMHPEGYRKALRVMKIADRFGLPIIVLIDTAGAYPGIAAEERGQGEAIARNIKEMALLRVPVVCVVIGEGGSGGALGVGLGDRVLMQENTCYSVISPEGCAAILWKDAKFAPQAAECLKITANDLLRLGIIDDIIPEPVGGAHRNPAAATDTLREYISRHLEELLPLSPETLMDRRFQKYRVMGVFSEVAV